MFNDVKLQVDYECEMAFEILRLVKKQLKEGYGRIVGIKRLHDDLEVTAAKISAHNFLTRLQKLSSYASGHFEVSELAACHEKASFSCTYGHVDVYTESATHLSYSAHPPKQTTLRR
ncbi:hypothetical protein Tco_0671559 [Tanacetum coccineum]